MTEPDKAQRLPDDDPGFEAQRVFLDAQERIAAQAEQREREKAAPPCRSTSRP